MRNIRELAAVIRSKNCSPFELTFDIIFFERGVYQRVKEEGLIGRAQIAQAYGIPESAIRSFTFFDPAKAVKAVMARAVPSGSPGDSDVYGAQQHGPLLSLVIDV